MKLWYTFDDLWSYWMALDHFIQLNTKLKNYLRDLEYLLFFKLYLSYFNFYLNNFHIPEKLGKWISV